MHKVTTAIDGLKIKPPPWLRGVTVVVLTTFAAIALSFWPRFKPSLKVAAIMLTLQVLAMVVMGIILIERFPILRRAVSKSRRFFRSQIRGVQERPEERTQAQWDEVRATRHKHRRVIFFLISAIGTALLTTYLWKQGVWGKLLSGLTVYLYCWTVASRINVTKPFPGMTLERVGADVGEPVSTSPNRLGMVSIALKWVRGDFPPKTKEKPETKEKPTSPKLRLLAVVSAAFFRLPAFLFFCVFWPFLGWPATRYTLGAGDDPNVSISQPKFSFLRLKVRVLYSKASAFNRGETTTCLGDAVNWDPGVLALGGGEVREEMNFPWCPEWFMEKVLDAGTAARKQR